jgi:hypothetical protein
MYTVTTKEKNMPDAESYERPLASFSLDFTIMVPSGTTPADADLKRLAERVIGDEVQRLMDLETTWTCAGQTNPNCNDSGVKDFPGSTLDDVYSFALVPSATVHGMDFMEVETVDEEYPDEIVEMPVSTLTYTVTLEAGTLYKNCVECTEE